MKKYSLPLNSFCSFLDITNASYEAVLTWPQSSQQKDFEIKNIFQKIENWQWEQIIFYIPSVTILFEVLYYKKHFLSKNILFIPADLELKRILYHILDNSLVGPVITYPEPLYESFDFEEKKREEIRHKLNIGPAARVFAFSASNLALAQAQYMAQLFVDFWLKTKANTYLILLGDTQDWQMEYSNYESVPNKFFAKLDSEIRRSYVESHSKQNQRIYLWPKFSRQNLIDLFHISDIYMSCSLPPHSPSAELTLAKNYFSTLVLGPREQEILPDTKVYPLAWWHGPNLSHSHNLKTMGLAYLNYHPKKTHHVPTALVTSPCIKPTNKLGETKKFYDDLICSIHNFPHYHFQEKRRVFSPNNLYKDIFMKDYI